MPKWKVRVQVHDPQHQVVLWQGDAQDREQAMSRALRYAEQQLERSLDLTIRVTLHVATA
jgi:hypothetical protein